MVAAAMLLHAWVRTRVTERGYALSRLSAEYRDLMREHERLQIAAAELKSPQRIEELARTRLNMGPPPVDRVVVLVGGAVRASVLTASRRSHHEAPVRNAARRQVAAPPRGAARRRHA